MTARRLVAAAAALLLVAGCASGDDDTATDGDTTTIADTAADDSPDDTSAVTTPADTDSTAATTEPASPATTAPTATTQPVATTEPPEPFYGDFEVVIAQHTPESGGGLRPRLIWDAVDGADHYAVYLYAPSGEAYWAWRGRETEVFVGGATQLADGSPGPSVSDGMSWAVVAYDADLLPVAASPMRSITP